MDWEKVDGEYVANEIPSELKTVYEAWIEKNPDKTGRLEEIAVRIRTEVRDAIQSAKKNVLDPREEYLPVSSIRHMLNLVWYTLCMDMGFPLSAAATSSANAANLYLRQVAYGRYTFKSEDGSGDLVPSGTIPARKEYGTRTLAAVLLLLFCLAVPSRAEWGRAPYMVASTNVAVDFTPLNYPITTASLFSHLQGIDTMIGRLTDTNSLYGDLVALPAVVYNLMDVLKTQALYGEYREDAEAWIVTSQTNVLFWGNLAANRLLVREDGATIHGDSEILDGNLAVDGDVDVGGGMTLGGVRRDSWPQSPYGPGGETMYLPAWNDGWSYGDVYGDYCVDPQSGTMFPGNLAVCGTLHARGAVQMLGSLTLSNQTINGWGDLTNGLNSRMGAAESEIAANAADIAENGRDITALEGSVQAQFDTIANQQLDISRLKTATNRLTSSVAANTRGVASNTAAISALAANTLPVIWSGACADIGDEVSFQSSVHFAEPVDAYSLEISDSLTVGSDTWTGLPDMGKYATTGQVAAVSNRLSSYLPKSGGHISGSLAQGLGVSALGYCALAVGDGTVASAEYSFADGNRSKASAQWCHASGNRAVSSNKFAFAWQGADTTNLYGSHGVGTWSINPQGGLSGFYVGQTNMSEVLGGYATTSTVAALLQALSEATNRIAELEWETSEYWCKWNVNDLSVVQTNWVPTNWPAKRICVEVRSLGASNTAVIALRPGWAPPKNCDIEFVFPGWVADSGTVKIQIGSTLFSGGTYSNSSSAVFQKVNLHWDTNWACWTPTKSAFANYWNRLNTNGSTVNYKVGNALFPPVHDLPDP